MYYATLFDSNWSFAHKSGTQASIIIVERAGIATLSAISLWVTILLAVWRCLPLFVPVKQGWRLLRFLTNRNSIFSVLTTQLLVLISFIPHYVYLRSQSASKHSPSLNEKLSEFWIRTTAHKVVPCVLLTSLTVCLVHLLWQERMARNAFRHSLSCYRMSARSQSLKQKRSQSTPIPTVSIIVTRHYKEASLPRVSYVAIMI